MKTIKLCVETLILCSLFGFAPLLISSSQTALPNNAESTDTLVGTQIAWTNLCNLFSDTDNGAMSSCTPVGPGEYTEELFAFTYEELNIPASATLNGIEVEIHWEDPAWSAGDNPKEVRIQLKLNGDLIGTNKSTGACVPNSATNGVNQTYGSNTDLWGAGSVLTPTRINLDVFGVVLQWRAPSANSGNISFEIDAVTITVHYTNA